MKSVGLLILGAPVPPLVPMDVVMGSIVTANPTMVPSP
jgi:hypothetical protein